MKSHRSINPSCGSALPGSPLAAAPRPRAASFLAAEVEPFPKRVTRKFLPTEPTTRTPQHTGRVWQNPQKRPEIAEMAGHTTCGWGHREAYRAYRTRSALVYGRDLRSGLFLRMSAAAHASDDPEAEQGPHATNRQDPQRRARSVA